MTASRESGNYNSCRFLSSFLLLTSVPWWNPRSKKRLRHYDRLFQTHIEDFQKAVASHFQIPVSDIGTEYLIDMPNIGTHPSVAFRRVALKAASIEFDWLLPRLPEKHLGGFIRDHAKVVSKYLKHVDRSQKVESERRPSMSEFERQDLRTSREFSAGL